MGRRRDTEAAADFERELVLERVGRMWCRGVSASKIGANLGWSVGDVERVARVELGLGEPAKAAASSSDLFAALLGHYCGTRQRGGRDVVPGRRAVLTSGGRFWEGPRHWHSRRWWWEGA